MSYRNAGKRYETRWKNFAHKQHYRLPNESTLGLAVIPWPIHLVCVGKGHAPSSLRVDDLTIDTVSAFLPPLSTGGDKEPEVSKRFRSYPDKFEGRVMPRVQADERSVVRKAVGVVARTLHAGSRRRRSKC